VGVPLLVSLVALVLLLVVAVHIRRHAVAGGKAAGMGWDRRHAEMDAVPRIIQASRGAEVTVHLSPPTSDSACNIEVHNAGPAPAEIITVMSLDADNGRSCPITRAWLELSGPLRAGLSRQAVAGLPPQSNHQLRVALVWHDDNGSHRTESVLQV
jgi:hypothetical protein